VRLPVSWASMLVPISATRPFEGVEYQIEEIGGNVGREAGRDSSVFWGDPESTPRRAEVSCGRYVIPGFWVVVSAHSLLWT